MAIPRITEPILDFFECIFLPESKYGKESLNFELFDNSLKILMCPVFLTYVQRRLKENELI